MIPVFNIKNKLLIKILIISNIIIIIASLLFFDFYKKRKITLYNQLYEDKKREIKKIESLFSKYYHSNDKFIFNKKNTNIIKTNKKEYLFTTIDTDLYFSKVIGKSTAYIDIFDNDLILATATGLFFKVNIENLNKEKFFPVKLNSNISDFFKNENFFVKSHYGIKDILINNEDLYVSYSNEVSKDCFNTGILKSKINNRTLFFEKFFDHKECSSKKKSKYKTFKMGQAGGRIIKYMDDLLLTHGSYSEFDEVQSDNSIFGKILLIDKAGNLKKIFSKGHRNPQGLSLFKKNTIFQTEHGPQGGDEINIIKENGNYGWPKASYGSHYDGQKNMNKFYPLPFSHNEFEEPILYFKKAIAISQILYVPKNFTKEKDDSLFLASMKVNNDFGEDINLFHLKYKDEKIIIYDLIPIAERIRDLIYDANNNYVIMFLDTSASIGILSIN